MDYHYRTGIQVDDSSFEPSSAGGYVTLDTDGSAAIDPIAIT